MKDHFDRRRLLQLSLAAVPSLLLLGSASACAEDFAKTVGGTGPQHDFDFFLGTWNVKHRRLKKWLVGNKDWEEFDGTTHCQSILGGIANMNDSVVNRSGGSYRGLGLRAYDAKTNNWADWYLDGRDPTQIDAPGIGRFANGVGTFFSDDTFEGKPVKLRGMFSPITPTSAQWEQAYSADGGKTWETNWLMRYTRTA
jgi:hypothetical protein